MQFIIDAMFLIAATVALAIAVVLVVGDPTNVMLDDICATRTCGTPIG